jgi:hypothetical protein
MRYQALKSTTEFIGIARTKSKIIEEKQGEKWLSKLRNQVVNSLV